MKSASNVVRLQAPSRRRRDELAFLPAALEIVERPPSPIGRSIVLVIIAAFCVALAWASFGKIDIVASAQGKVVPTGRSKVIQPFETGVVKAIHVRDGQSVRAGDVLIELDPTMNAAERDHLQGDLIAAQLDVARLRAATGDADPMASFQPLVEATAGQISTQRQLLSNQMAELRAKLASLDEQKRQREAEKQTIMAAVDKINAVLPVLDQRVDIRKTLFDHATGSKMNYLEILQSEIELKHELLVQQSRYREAEAALGALTEARAQAVAETRRGWLGELAEAERKAAGLARDVERATEKTKLQSLTAPIDGVVQQLAVHTVGGVVTPAQVLLVVVPSDTNLEIEAMVPNRDIGFVHQGQEAAIKVDTFNFTQYGLLRGKVVSVSQDAIARNRTQDGVTGRAPGSENQSSEPKGQELVYSARISLEKTKMQVDEREINLSPGMAVTAEIKTGQRSVMSYLLSPLLRHQKESLHER